MNNLGTALAAATSEILQRIVDFLPSLIGALLLVIAGWLIGRILRALTVRAALLVETLASRLGSTPGAEPLRMRRIATVLGTIVFWAALLVFLTAATHVLELTSFTDWLARLVSYLPTLAAGVLIVIAGYVLSRFVADLVAATSHRLETTQRALLARVVQVKWGLLVFTLALAAHARLRVLPKLSNATLRSLAWHIRLVTIAAVLFVLAGVSIRFGGYPLFER